MEILKSPQVLDMNVKPLDKNVKQIGMYLYRLCPCVHLCAYMARTCTHTLSSTRELMAFEHSPVSSQDSGERSPFPSPPTDGDKVDELF